MKLLQTITSMATLYIIMNPRRPRNALEFSFMLHQTVDEITEMMETHYRRTVIAAVMPILVWEDDGGPAID